MITAYQGCTILVTGGAGFIGSHLVEQLVLWGAEVRVLDDLSTGNLDNLSHLIDKITFIQGSITDNTLCRKAVDGCAIIFHLAAYISVPGSFENPHHCYQVNMQGTQLLLDNARLFNVQRVVFASSCAVYGAQEGPLSEKNSCHPQSPYGLSKLIGEMLCNQYTHDFGLQTVSLRYFNVFGSRQSSHGPYAGVVAKFRAAMKNNQPLVIFGDGLQSRDFVPVKTIVEANLKAGMLPSTYVSGRVYNIATGKSVTLLQLIEQLKEEFPLYNAPIEHRPARAGDVQTVQADIKAYQELI